METGTYGDWGEGLSEIVRIYGQQEKLLVVSFFVLTAKAQYNLANAENYFREHLSAGDYYAKANK